jgi:hypothetical protein
MNPIKVTYALLLLSMTYSFTPAQQSFPAAGLEASATAGYASISIGQFSNAHFSGALGQINEGVQHPYEIFVLTGIENPEEFMLNLKAYPNPASRMIILQAENSDHNVLEYQLYDNIGTLLKTEKLNSEVYIIPFQQYNTGIYYLNVLSDSKPVKTFKIVKNE